jgi:hypothetical protein
MSHLDEGQLHELLDGELDENARAAALAHLAGCERCRAAYEEAKSFLAEAEALVDAVQIAGGTRDTPQVEPTLARASIRSRSRLGTYRTLAWAASLVLAVGLGWYGSTLSRGTPEAFKSEAGKAAGAASDAVGPATQEQPVQVAPPAAAPAPALAGADRTVPRRPTAPQAKTTAPAGADAVLAAAANQAPVPMPEPATTASGAESSDLMTRRIAPVQEQPAPQAATSAPADREARRNERDATPLAELAGAEAHFAARQPAPALVPMEMEAAVRILGGSIRLIDGLTPTRVLGEPGSDQGGTSHVRVVYEDPPGRELWLDQRRVTSMADMRARAATALLPGDTMEVAGAAGARSLRWIDQSGFQLALTGFLPADSLRQVMRRVQ